MAVVVDELDVLRLGGTDAELMAEFTGGRVLAPDGVDELIGRRSYGRRVR